MVIIMVEIFSLSGKHDSMLGYIPKAIHFKLTLDDGKSQAVHEARILIPSKRHQEAIKQCIYLLSEYNPSFNDPWSRLMCTVYYAVRESLGKCVLLINSHNGKNKSSFLAIKVVNLLLMLPAYVLCNQFDKCNAKCNAQET